MAGKFALIIGNSEYQDENLTRLKAPEADVNALSALLRHPEIGAFDNVITLANELSATIRRTIARFFAQKTPDDLLLLYFSGHGILDDRGELFLATKDTERDLIRGTAIPASYITGEMDGSRSRRQVLILDCCHSGAFARGSKGVIGASVGTASAFEGTGYGRVVLTATDATQFAWEGDQVIGKAENSLFTHYMIEGLQTGQADVDEDGRITLDNLYDYVYGRVVQITPKQTPGKWSYRQQGEIVIANNPKPIVKSVELPRELREAIESPLSGIREGAIYELTRLLNGNIPGLALSAYESLKQLMEDDSRRVATAAAQAIANYDARLKSNQVQTGQEKISSQPMGQQSVRTERPKTVTENSVPNMVRPLIFSKLSWGILFVTLGWMAAFAIFAQSVFEDHDAVQSAMVGAIGGLAIGVTLRWLYASVRWYQIALIIGGWIIGLYLGGLLYADWYGYIAMTLGGVATGLTLRWIQSTVGWSSVALIAIAWTMGGFFGVTLGLEIYSTLGNYTISSGVIGLVTGAIGGLVTLMQISRARRAG